MVRRHRRGLPSQRLTTILRNDTKYHLVKIGESGGWKVISACRQDVPHDDLLLATNQFNQPGAGDCQRPPSVVHPSRMTFTYESYAYLHTVLHFISTFNPFHRRDKDGSHGCGPCGGKTTTILPEQAKNFTFDTLGNLKPIEFLLDSSTTAHKLTIMDLDRKDLRMAVFVDGDLFSVTSAVEPDPTQDCGGDLHHCLHMQFSAGVSIIPPGRHIVQIVPIEHDGFRREGE